LGKVNEAMQRVALGFSKNPSVTPSELFLYLHSVMQPFVRQLVQEQANQQRAAGLLMQGATVEAHQAASAKGTSDNAMAPQEIARPVLEDADAEDEWEGLLPSYLGGNAAEEEEQLQALYANGTKLPGASGQSSKKLKKKRRRGNDVEGFRANVWLPHEVEHSSKSEERRAIVAARDAENQAYGKVVDGASAPKLTGYYRFKRTHGGLEVADNAEELQRSGVVTAGSIVAVRFCLVLLNAALKQAGAGSGNGTAAEREAPLRVLAEPMLPLLVNCLKLTGGADVVPLALKAITAVLPWRPNVPRLFSRGLGNRVLKIMIQAGAIVSTDNELVQACLKTLSSLFRIYTDRTPRVKGARAPAEEEEGNGKEQQENALLPIDEQRIRMLLDLVGTSLNDMLTKHQNAAFGLLRAIIDAKVLVPELFGLVTRLADQVVYSHRSGVRDAASGTVISFLLAYPLSQKNLVELMKQLLANCSYEYEEGRVAALGLLRNLVKLLPLPVLADFSNMIVLSMATAVINDSSAAAAAAAGTVMASLLSRSEAEFTQQVMELVLQWLGQAPSELQASTRAVGVMRVGAAVAEILAAARPDVLKSAAAVGPVLRCIQPVLALLLPGFKAMTGETLNAAEESEKNSTFPADAQNASNNPSTDAQDIAGDSPRVDLVYRLISLTTTLLRKLPSATNAALVQTPGEAEAEGAGRGVATPPPFMELVQEAVLFPQARVRTAACVLLRAYLEHRDCTRLAEKLASGGSGEVLFRPNGLFQMVRRLCIILNQPILAPDFKEPLQACLLFLLRAMRRHPELALLPTNRPPVATGGGGGAGAGDLHSGATSQNGLFKATGSSAFRKDSRGGSQQPSSSSSSSSLSSLASMGSSGSIGGSHNSNSIGSGTVRTEPLPASGEEASVQSDAASSDCSTADHLVLGNSATTAAAAIGPDRKSLPTTQTTTQFPQVSLSEVALEHRGCNWPMQRLRGIGSDNRGLRCLYVVEIFARLVALEPVGFSEAYAAPMIEVAYRGSTALPGPNPQQDLEIKEACTLFLAQIEAKMGAAAFIEAYSAVQQRVRNIKTERKRQAAVEAVSDPRAHAMRKVEKAEAKRAARKRKADKVRVARGGKKARNLAILTHD
jgi:hypothetical protein